MQYKVIFFTDFLTMLCKKFSANDLLRNVFNHYCNYSYSPDVFWKSHDFSRMQNKHVALIKVCL